MSRTQSKSEGRKITGVTLAFVNVKEGKPPVEFYEGDTLPADLDQDELDRLDGLGVFGEHPRAEAARRAQMLAQAGLPARPPLRSEEETKARQSRLGEDDESDSDDPLAALGHKELDALIASRPDVVVDAKANKDAKVAAIRAADDRSMAAVANPAVDPTVGHGGDGRDPHADPSSE